VVALFNSGYVLDPANNQKFKVAVRKSKTYAELLEHVENEFVNIELVYTPRNPANKISNYSHLISPSSLKCHFNGSYNNAWDVCLYCGSARFYNEGKECSVLIANKDNEL
jgi:hypothetical protein